MTGARRGPGWVLALVLSCGVAAAAPVTRPEVLRSHPHDPKAFTQGLLHYQGKLYESTGQLGKSTLRRVDVETGVVERLRPLASELFGEGLARVGDRLFQLTWQNGIARVHSLSSLELLRTFRYRGEGWGLCYDGELLVMSDGSARLAFRDPDTFEVVRRLTVTHDGAPLARLNELECVGEAVYANVWLTDHIVRIDKRTGSVVALIDATGLRSAAAAKREDVLNGIAHDAETGHFFLTGKNWPKLFEVRLGARGGQGAAQADGSRSPPPRPSAAKPERPSVPRGDRASTCGCLASGSSRAASWLVAPLVGIGLLYRRLGCRRRRRAPPARR